MPAQETSHLYQRALLWRSSGVNKFGRHKREAISVEIGCRWDDRRYEALDPQGNAIALDAQVIVAVDVPIGSIMWKGSLDDLSEALTGTSEADTSDVPTSDLFEVVIVNRDEDLKKRATYRELGLQRYTDTMPES